MSKDSTGSDGKLDGQLQFDSFQLTYSPGNTAGGTYYFDDLRAVKKSSVGVESKDNEVQPAGYVLAQNFPNPFNPSTIIKYQLKESVFVSLKVYDILGKEVAVLVNDIQTAGEHKLNFNAMSLTSGMYIYRLQAGSYIECRKMMLIR